MPALKYEYGPTFADLPIFASVAKLSKTVASAATSQFTNVVLGPITAPLAIMLFPDIAVPG
ncbi:unannotated protein [freshwater metagenome]|uniref:Unannotated protein n=1 Tax=freshwater metagenome TaxID=449393 RepID=A0A6J6H446_9ZZZZ